LRGIRIQNIVRELNGEKIDVVVWSPDTSAFISNALSPAQVLASELNKEEKAAVVVVPDRQFSLAIGREGQNVRLAAKLTGWRIDVKNASVVEAERLTEVKPPVEAEEEAVVGEEPLAEMPAMVATEATEEEAEPVPALETAFVPPPVPAVEKPQIRFAEDVLVSGPTKPVVKSKKKKKDTYGKKGAEDGIKIRKMHRQEEVPTDEEEYEY